MWERYDYAAKTLTYHPKMKFTNPNALWLLVLAVPLMALELKRALGSPKRHRSSLSLAARFILFVLLTLSVAAPYTPGANQRVSTLVALLDISSSITETQGDALLNSAREIGDKLAVSIAIAPFAGGVVPRAVKLSSDASYREIRQAWQGLDSGVSDLEKALASRALKESPALLLLSDGYESRGSARRAAQDLTGKPIFPVISQGEDSQTKLSISQLYAPRVAPLGRSVQIKVSLSNSDNIATDATLEIRHGRGLILERKLTLAAGVDTTVSAESDVKLEGLHPVEAKIKWSDKEGEHTVTRSTWVANERRDRVLLLSGALEDERFIAEALNGESYQLRSFVGANIADKVAEIGELSAYRSVVLNNLPLRLLLETILTGLNLFVKSGGGLVVVGGISSYGLGGYIGSKLEPILPVKLLPPQPEKKRLTIAVQLVVDKSRSMATDNRLEFAKLAAAEVVRNLKDDDLLGVIGFDEVPFIALPIARVASVRDSAISRISRLFPTSRTNLFPALDEARRGLSSAMAGRKHVIVLTDGKLPDPGPHYFELLRQMRFIGTTVSTIMVGNEVDDGFLARMAEQGGGAFYQTNDPSNLPKVFLSDVKVASGEGSLREEAEMSVRPGPDKLVSTEVSAQLQSYPSLRGFVQTLERESAETELLVRDSGGTHPLLASWNVGLGRVIGFTSDFSGRWTPNWVRWERARQFWSDLVESSHRRDSGAVSEASEFDLRSWVDGGEVLVDLSVFADLGDRSVRGEVVKPDGERVSVDFVADKPGHYLGRIQGALAGAYRGRIVVLGAAEGVGSNIGRIELPEVGWELDGVQFGERPHREVEYGLLSDLARITGGRVLTTGGQDSDGALRVLDRSLVTRGQGVGYQHLLLVLGLVVFLGGVLGLGLGARR